MTSTKNQIVFTTPSGWKYTLLPGADPDSSTTPSIFIIRQVLSDPTLVSFMKDAFFLKGGWEPWLQVQAAVTLKRANPHLNISREEMVWEGSRDLIDLWLQDATAKTAAGIEIKSRNLNTKGSSDSNKSLAALMVTDVNKVGSDLKADYKTVQVGTTRVAQHVDMFAIAITGEPMDLVWSRQAPGATEPTFWNWNRRTDIQWCYLSMAKDLTVDKDIVRMGQSSIDKPLPYENLYLIWYKK